MALRLLLRPSTAFTRTSWSVHTASCAASRAFSSKAPVADNLFATAESSSGGRWSPESIERRLTKRPRTLRDDQPSGRGNPGKSEEDFWLAAEAPGYTSSELSTPRATANASAPAAPSVTPPLISHYPTVRVSQSSITFPVLPAFLQLYHGRTMPCYAACDGFLSAQLLVGGLPTTSPVRDILASAYVRSGPAAVLPVVSIVVWRDDAAMTAAAESEAYRACMLAMGEFLQSTPTSTVFAQCASSAGAAGDHAHPDQLGLR